MRKLRRILVALDASPRAPAVLEAAEAIARDSGAKLRLFRAVPIQPGVPWNMIRAFPPGGLEGAPLSPREREMATLARRVSPSLVDGIVTAVGTTAATVVNRADRSVLVVRNTG